MWGGLRPRWGGNRTTLRIKDWADSRMAHKAAIAGAIVGASRTADTGIGPILNP
jgi:hypothetical protein